MGVYTEEAEKDNKEKSGMSPLEVETCFFCGRNLFTDEISTGAVVIWEGHTGQIALHQGCAELFSIHLIQDAQTLTSIVKKRVELQTRGTWEKIR